jgi:glycosyltransferase involved in cell wall biosynthesis
LVGDKGIVELEKAFRSLESSYPNLHLLLIGPFEPRDAVPADVRERLHGNPRIHLISEFIDPSPLYAAMDIVVLPTYREGFPNVPLEAAAMRLPVVATLIPGCIDAVQDGVTGSLVPPRNAEALAEAIARYIDEPDLLRQHGAKGRERVLSEFRQEVIWQALYEEYARLLNNAGLSISAEAKVA